MTIPQIHGFLEAITKRKASENASFISHVALGSQGDAKGIKKAVKAYTEQIKKKKKV